jgi:hypothetical protein
LNRPARWRAGAPRGGLHRPANGEATVIRIGLGIVLVAVGMLVGCGRSAPPVQVQPQSGLERARTILKDYAEGAPMGSEAATFEEIVAEVRQSDPQKADLLEKGLTDLRRSPQNLRDKARALLKQL